MAKERTSIIGIENLKINCIIGNDPSERMTEQVILIDLKVEGDIPRTAMSDRLEDTADYAAIAAVCVDLAKTKRFRLLESLAGAIVSTLLRKNGVRWVWVRIKKPGRLPFADSCYVEYEESMEGI